MTEQRSGKKTKAWAPSKRKASFEDIVDDNDDDQDFAPTQRKKPRSKFCPVLLPRKIMEGDHVSQMVDRNATTYRQQGGNVAAVLQDAKSADGSDLDINQFVISKNSAQRARKNV